MGALTLPELLISAASEHPQRIAADFGEQRLSYAELGSASANVAARLAECGVKRGMRVALWLPKTAEALVSLWGVAKTGATCVPVNCTDPPTRVASILADCRASGLVTTPQLWAALAESSDSARDCSAAVFVPLRGEGALHDTEPPWSVREAIDCPVDRPSPRQPRPADIAYILYTSGSTGSPKGVAISHRAALAFVNWAHAYFGIQPQDRLANHASWSFDLSVFDLFVAAAAGAAVVPVPDRESRYPASLAEWIGRAEISVWYSVPSAFAWWTRRGAIENRKYPCLRLILLAGEVCPPADLHRVMQLLQEPRCFNLYGPTETNVCTVYEVETPPQADESIPIGIACSHCDVFVVGDDAKETPIGVAGEVYVAGESLMSGYWGSRGPVKSGLHRWTATDGRGLKVYRTGDLAERRADGNLVFLGRRDQQVKIDGYRVEPAGVEREIQRGMGVAWTIVPFVDRDDRTRLAAFLESDDESAPDEAFRFCQTHLPSYMVPSRFVNLMRMPKTSNGKVDRKALLAMAVENAFAKWVARRALEDLRAGRSLIQEIAEPLNSMPYIDPLRDLLTEDDRALILSLLDHRDWWTRKLAINISRKIADDEIVARLRARYRMEKHFHTKLSIIYALCGMDRATARDKSRYLVWMADPDNAALLRRSVGQFYGEGGSDARVIVRNLRARLENPRFHGSTFIYVYSLGLWGGRGCLEFLRGYLNHPDRPTRTAAKDALDYLTRSSGTESSCTPQEE